jgi:5-methylcytosine-specific restriction endonuclease McrA
VKVCKKCGQPRDRVCKPCRNSTARAWAAANTEKRKKANDKYYAAKSQEIHAVNKVWKVANKDRLVELTSARLARNKGTIQAQQAQYHLANKQKINERSAAWRAANPEKSRIQQQNRRAKVRSVGGKLSSNLVEKLFALQKGRCACCGAALSGDTHLDHIMPIALGGVNKDSNMQLLTQRCNNQKHAKHPVDFMRERGFLI